MTKHRISFVAGLLAVLSLTACSSQTAYNMGQAWRQNQCNAMTNMDDRQRCMKEAGQPYDNYQKGVDDINAKK
ncbi:MAG: hypothetical protein EPO09_04920 [Aquabacterium sp.]|uniref:hypothetical protein n=1 Tax=Aquabacterium sp. TaxID=1872578 RepID=UPI001214B186|nr:hypothetical protein [Aquabacterium sp.]TAK97081.1 MAG: hypothetical protein EPO09_04920 [Aquabacterium sp.]